VGSTTFITVPNNIRDKIASQKSSRFSHGINKLKVLDESIQAGSRQNFYQGPKAIYQGF
jgi:hypothetical protein